MVDALSPHALQIVEELRRRFDRADRKLIARPRARHVGELPVMKVRYEEFNLHRLDELEFTDLVSRKRRPFAYEQERRIVSTKTPRRGARAVLGERLGFALPGILKHTPSAS